MRLPSFSFEKRLWKKGFKLIAGCDEVGRGAFAGPVVVACVAFPNHLTIQPFNHSTVRIDDSKKLTDNQRRKADAWIKDSTLTYGIGESSVAEINRLGLSKATYSAFRRSVANANVRGHNRVEFLLIDAFYIPYVRGLPIGIKTKKLKKLRTKEGKDRGRQLAIVNGDEKCFSIAAASIVAKVYRDDVMIKKSQNKKFKEFKWEKNKGYGTSEHRKAIKKFGPTRFHRSKFVD